MQQAGLARSDLDKSTKIAQLGDLAHIDLAHNYIFGNRIDRVHGNLPLGSVWCSHEYRAIILDIDVTPSVGNNLLDDLAAGADESADLVSGNMHREDARSQRIDFAARSRKNGKHLVQDKETRCAGMIQGRGQQVAVDAVNLDVHL